MPRRTAHDGVPRDNAMSGWHGKLGSAARRRFLARAGIAAGAALVSGLSVVPLGRARESLDPVSGDVRYGMLIDAARCARDCDACVRACDDEHGLEPRHGPATDPRWIHKVTLRDRATGRISTLPFMCQHCADPPCVDVCPTGASFRRADGIVLVDKHTCIGCRYCVMACPFQARAFVHEAVENPRPWSPRGKGTVESCNLCVHRIDAGDGRGPALRRGVCCRRASRPRVRRPERSRKQGRQDARRRPERGAASRPRARHRGALPRRLIGSRSGGSSGTVTLRRAAGCRQPPRSTASTNAPIISCDALTTGSGPGKRPARTSAMNSPKPATRSACICAFSL